MNKLDTVILDNGLRIYLYNDMRRHSTFFQLSTFCGGITKHFKIDGKEYKINDGVSHILEHYIVECNENGNFLDKLGEAQMSTNAATSIYYTSYYFETVENVLYGIDTMLDGIYNVKFTEDKLEKLKGPIFQEIRGRFDNKFYHLSRTKLKCVFNNIDYIDVGGTLDEVSNTTVDDLELLYKAFYRPNNQFIVIAGNFNKDEVINKIKEFYNKLKMDKIDVELVSYKENDEISILEKDLIFPTPMDYIDITFKINISSYSNTELLDLDYYIHSFLDSFFGPVSAIHKRLVDEKIIIDGIGYSAIRIDKYLIVSIGSYTNNITEFKNSILDSIKKLDKFDSDIFEINKQRAIVNLVLRDENIFKMVNPLINNIVYFDYPYLDEVKDVEKLTFNKFIKCIKGLDFSNYTIIHIKSKD